MVEWHTIADGLCTDSMALETAREFQIPETILDRATVLQQAFDEVCRGDATGTARAENEEEAEAPLRGAEEDFYIAGMQGQDSVPSIEVSELGGTLSEAYERQGLEELLTMTMQMQQTETKEEKEEKKEKKDKETG